MGGLIFKNVDLEETRSDLNSISTPYLPRLHWLQKFNAPKSHFPSQMLPSDLLCGSNYIVEVRILCQLQNPVCMMVMLLYFILLDVHKGPWKFSNSCNGTSRQEDKKSLDPHEISNLEQSRLRLANPEWMCYTKP